MKVWIRDGSNLCEGEDHKDESQRNFEMEKFESESAKNHEFDPHSSRGWCKAVLAQICFSSVRGYDMRRSKRWEIDFCLN